MSYPKRPWNDGDRWIDGVRYAKGRPRRSDPFANIRRVNSAPRQVNTGPENANIWRALSPKSVLEFALRGELSPTQVSRSFKAGVWDRDEFRVEFLEGLKAGAMDGSISNPAELLKKYYSCLLVA